MKRGNAHKLDDFPWHFNANMLTTSRPGFFFACFRTSSLLLALACLDSQQAFALGFFSTTQGFDAVKLESESSQSLHASAPRLSAIFFLFEQHDFSFFVAEGSLGDLAA
ncbi:MAG: hypothetical protein WCK15_12565 [Pirellula sp.]